MTDKYMFDNTVLFENYELFLKEHAADMASPSQAIKALTDEGGFYRAYTDALTENLDPAVRRTVLDVLNRHREEVLTEAANVPASSFAYGWTVMSFPVLVDIYAEPIIAELCNVFTTDSAQASIPRVTIEAAIKSYDGSSETVYKIPSATNMIRPGIVEVVVPVNQMTNLFTAASLSAENLKLNRRYIMITKIDINDNDGANDHTITVNLNIRPDNRAQFVKEFKFTDSAGAEVTAYLTGHVNFDTGDMVYQVSFSGGTSGHTYTVLSSSGATVSLRFAPYNTMNGRVKVSIKSEMIDVTIDESDDFVIELSQEDIQDYKSIFKIDVVRTLSEAIKRQILLNKDLDLAYFLAAAESDIAANGAKAVVDLDAYTATGGTGDYTPANILDVFKAILPRLAKVAGVVKRNYQLYPSYIVTGVDSAALLRSLQDMAINFPTNKGEFGWNGAMAQFAKMKILESSAIDNSKMYLSVKAPQNALEKAAIIDLVYKPLYLINEVTDGLTRNFVRSRTMIEIARVDGLGCVEIQNLNNFM